MGFRARLRNYYQITKPGIVYGNLLTVAAGFLLGSRWHVDVALFVAVLVGTALVVASGCVFNNYIDRGIDAKMVRTRSRAFVVGDISTPAGLLFGGWLGVLGFAALLHTNWLTVGVGAVGIFSYVVVYGFAKRATAFGTLVGTVPGAASLIAGYTAATGRFDAAVLVLFVVMLAWQMVHFYAIAVRRAEDYATAGLPVWPVRYGVRSTVYQQLAFIMLFVLVAPLLTVLGYAGLFYAVGVVALGLRWFWVAFAGLYAREDTAWAKQTFLFSLVTLFVLCCLVAVGPVLP